MANVHLGVAFIEVTVKERNGLLGRGRQEQEEPFFCETLL